MCNATNSTNPAFESLGKILPYDVCEHIDYYKNISENMKKAKQIYIPWKEDDTSTVILYKTLDLKPVVISATFDVDYVKSFGSDYIELYASNDLDLHLDENIIENHVEQHQKLIDNERYFGDNYVCWLYPENTDWKFKGTITHNQEKNQLTIKSIAKKQWICGEFAKENEMITFIGQV